MEISLLYGLLEDNYLHDWQEEITKAELPMYIEREKEAEAELRKMLPEECKKALLHYSLAIVNKVDYLHYCLGAKILDFGVRVGMELQHAFPTFDKE